jgi:crotonobetainyl-CoA:carnitine CoA-transferase CaiB-like acyl-CoA transferase
MPELVKILKDLTVIDLGVGMAAALVCKYLNELGARVIRVEPPGGDPFFSVYPAYGIWKRGSILSPEARNSDIALDKLLADADVCICGGEDHPDITRRRDAGTLSARFPRLVVLDLEGYIGGMEDDNRPATDLLVQARSGLTWEHFTDRPVPMSFSPANYGAALRGLSGLLAALYEREGSGRGQLVSTSLFEGALGWVSAFWSELEKPTPASSFVMPKDPYPLIFRCADGEYIHLVIGAAGSKYRMYQALEIDDPSVRPDDASMPTPTDDPKNFFGDYEVLASHVAKHTSGELLARIWAQGLPAEPVLPAGSCWDMPQVAHNGDILTDHNGDRFVGHPATLTASPARSDKPGAAGDHPLSGVNVVDFGAFVAGPYASVVLADLGADVIKVETPAGDPNRSIFRSFSSANRGKRAITIDLKKSEGLGLARDLCKRSSVVTSNFRSGVSARLGIDPETLHREKPELVVLESPAYGSSGPLSDRAGFDMVMQALCGHEWRAGGRGNEPLWNRTSMVDYTGGFLGAVSVLAALYHQAHTGEGMTLDCALLSAGIFLTSELVQKPDGSFVGSEPLNQGRTGFYPAEALYQLADGWIAICIRNEEQSTALAQVLALTEKLPTNPSSWDPDAGELIAAALVKRRKDEVVPALEAAGVWLESCRKDVDRELLDVPFFEKNKIIQSSFHPNFGRVREMGAMLRFSRSDCGHLRGAPVPGSATRDILLELGISEDTVAHLLQDKIIA